jgi:hypothetical protein
MNRMWIALLLLLLEGIGAPNARADNFEFSFTNAIGTVAGTVTGEILGLTNNGVPGPASDVIIASYPSLFNSEPGLGTPPVDTASWLISSNLFTEAGGVVSAACFVANIDNDTFALSTSSLCFGFSGELDSFSPPGGDVLTLSHPVFSSAAASIPEPSPGVLMLIGAGLLGLVLAMRRNSTPRVDH